MKDELGRRKFLNTAAQMAAAGAVCAGIASGAVSTEKKMSLANTIPTSEFGKTGIKLPILGYGGAALPKSWGNPLGTVMLKKESEYEE